MILFNNTRAKMREMTQNHRFFANIRYCRDAILGASLHFGTGIRLIVKFGHVTKNPSGIVSGILEALG